jgi:hypothetical protein
LPEYFGFPLPISFHRCSIRQKNGKKLISFITGLHNKPEGCDASVASAAGTFTTKKKHEEGACFSSFISQDVKTREYLEDSVID